MLLPTRPPNREFGQTRDCPAANLSQSLCSPVNRFPIRTHSVSLTSQFGSKHPHIPVPWICRAVAMGHSTRRWTVQQQSSLSAEGIQNTRNSWK